MTIYIQNLERIIPPELYGKLSPSLANAMVGDIANAAWTHWKKLAATELRSTKDAYSQGIQNVVWKGNTAVISLVGRFPVMIEQGIKAPIDQRKFLLGSDVPVAPRGERGKHEKVTKTGKKEYYRAIPFRHGTPGSRGTVGAAMGSQFVKTEGEGRAKDIGKAIYKAARKHLKDDPDDPEKPGYTRSQPGKGTTYGARLSEKITSAIAPKLKPIHSSDIFAGMIRSAKIYRVAQQTQYTTFRTISTDGDKKKWIIPPRPGKRLAKKVTAYMNQKVIPNLAKAYLEGT